MASDYNPFYENVGPETEAAAYPPSYNAALTGNTPTDNSTNATVPPTSIWDSIMSNTVGVLWRAGTGTVDPWTKSQMQQANQDATLQAAGPNATPQQKQSAVDKAWLEVENYLKSLGADPSQANQGLKTSLTKAIGWAAVFIIIALAVFGFAYGKGARASLPQ